MHKMHCIKGGHHSRPLLCIRPGTTVSRTALAMATLHLVYTKWPCPSKKTQLNSAKYHMFTIIFLMIPSNRLGEGATFPCWPWIFTEFHREDICNPNIQYLKWHGPHQPCQRHHLLGKILNNPPVSLAGSSVCCWGRPLLIKNILWLPKGQQGERLVQD